MHELTWTPTVSYLRQVQAPMIRSPERRSRKFQSSSSPRHLRRDSSSMSQWLGVFRIVRGRKQLR